jgi:hypothetical protein
VNLNKIYAFWLPLEITGTYANALFLSHPANEVEKPIRQQKLVPCRNAGWEPGVKKASRRFAQASAVRFEAVCLAGV